MRIEYRSRMLEKMVHEWDNENGQGEYLHSLGGYDLGYFSNLAEAIEACGESIGYDGEVEKDYFDGGFLALSVIEDSNGHQNDNGAYICDYTFLIEKHQISAITEEDLDKILS